jgi:hypothetical protein
MLTRPMVAPARPAGHGPVTNSSPSTARDFWVVTVGPVALLEFPADDRERAANNEFPVKQFRETHYRPSPRLSGAAALLGVVMR